MPTNSPAAVATGFAESAEPECQAQCDKSAFVRFTHEVPVNQNAVSENIQEQKVPKTGEKSGRKSWSPLIKQLSFFQD